MKLTLKIRRINNVIFGWVESQDEGLRVGRYGQTKALACRLLPSSKKMFKIESYCMPELYKDRLYIRGYSKIDDKQPFAYAYKDRTGAKEAYAAIVDLVAEINRSPEAPKAIVPEMDTIGGEKENVSRSRE